MVVVVVLVLVVLVVVLVKVVVVLVEVVVVFHFRPVNTRCPSSPRELQYEVNHKRGGSATKLIIIGSNLLTCQR